VFLLTTMYTQAETYFKTNGAQQDPYEILGVSRGASPNAIKQKWRSLSKIHHPDKGGTAEKFAALSSAYEILSNPHERSKYDQQNFQTNQKQQDDNKKRKDAERRAKQFKTQQDALRRVRSQQAQVMQKYLLRIRSLEEMVDIGILSTDNIFLGNFVGVFVGNKKQEKAADNDFMFPFPFSGDARNGFQWEDILVTAKIRYNRSTELTRLFRVPVANTDNPYIIFGRSGDSVSNIQVFQQVGGRADPQEQLKKWIAGQLKSRVTVVNHHHSSVNLYLVHDQSKSTREGLEFVTILRSGFSASISSDIGDKLLVIDSKVDAFPGSPGIDASLFKGSESPIFKKFSPRPNPQDWYFQNPAIMEEFIIRGPMVTLEIKGTTCFDLSLRCESWILSGTKPQERSACHQQPEFMHAICPASCGVCQRSRISWIDRVHYAAKYAPVYKFPTWTRPCVKFGRFVAHDMHNILTMRRTVAVVFFAVGAILGLNLFVIPKSFLGTGPNSTGSEHSRKDYFSVPAIVATFAFWGWLHFISPNSSLRRDWHHVLEWQVDAIIGLVGFGAAIALLKSAISTSWLRSHTMPRRTKVVNSCVGVVLFCASSLILVVAAINIDPAQGRRARWHHLWRMRKNIAFALFLSGLVFGQAIFPISRFLRRRPGFIIAVILDLCLFAILRLMPVLDRFFVKDFHHVVQVRMSGAIPIGIAGLILGFGTPLSLYLQKSKSRSMGETCHLNSLRFSKLKTS
jgi:curved DNA-binding protein CbpA